MKILSHRGYWRVPEEKNTLAAFQHTVRSGFGTELDVRDHLGQLVISHDPVAADAKILLFQDVVKLFSGTDLPLAINIKADGLTQHLAAVLTKASFPWFVFDMSGPEHKRYLDANFAVFTRHSDIEPVPICYDRSVGVWLDDFVGGWIVEAEIAKHLNAGKQVCVVSPELHRREPEALWAELRRSKCAHDDNLLLCTDDPDKAKRYFSPS